MVIEKWGLGNRPIPSSVEILTYHQFHRDQEGFGHSGSDLVFVSINFVLLRS